MKQIWKYQLKRHALQTVEMPEHAQIISFQMQHDSTRPRMDNSIMTFWAIVETENTFETRKFGIVGTGHEIVWDKFKYIGTVQDGAYVWHLLEVL